jgi:hypothetical protein
MRFNLLCNITKIKIALTKKNIKGGFKMTSQEILKAYQDFTALIPANQKVDEIFFLKNLPAGCYYIFRNWNGADADILFKSKFTKTIKSLYEGLNNTIENFIILKA